MTDPANYLQTVGELGLGSRLKVLSDQLYDVADTVYRRRGSRFRARWFPVMRLVRDRGPQTVTEAARALGLSHPAVSQLAQKLIQGGWLTTHADATDGRRRLLALTPRAQIELRRLAPVWSAIRESFGERPAVKDLLSALQRFGDELSAPALADQIAERATALERDAVEIIPFRKALRDHFYRINAGWLRAHFYLEEFDHRVLSNPEREILEPGGAILFARVGDDIVGTCALRLDAPGRYELTKMAVDEHRRGLGIGRKLIEATIAEFHRLKGKALFLESSSKLTAAIRLYESAGFVHTPRPALSHYQRADVYMVHAEPGRPRAPARRRQRSTAGPRRPAQ